MASLIGHWMGKRWRPRSMLTSTGLPCPHRRNCFMASAMQPAYALSRPQSRCAPCSPTFVCRLTQLVHQWNARRPFGARGSIACQRVVARRLLSHVGGGGVLSADTRAASCASGSPPGSRRARMRRRRRRAVLGVPVVPWLVRHGMARPRVVPWHLARQRVARRCTAQHCAPRCRPARHRIAP